MPSDCNHQCCQDCAINYFTITIRDKTIGDATCPFCNEPSTLNESEEIATRYFAKLDMFLKKLLEKNIYDLFQRKVRDRFFDERP